MGFEQLKNIIDFNRAQPDGDKEDIENNICPEDAWLLEVNSKGEKSCPFCGRIYR